MTRNNIVEEFLGIDIGCEVLKVVRLAMTADGLAVTAQARVPFPAPVIDRNMQLNKPEILTGLSTVKSLLTRNSRNTHSCVSISGFMTTTRFVRLPESTTQEFHKLLQSECQTYCDPESFIFSAKLLDRLGNFRYDPDMPKWRRDMLLLMVEKDILADYHDIAELASIPNPDFSVDFLGLAQAFSAENARNIGPDNEVTGIIHVGAMNTSISVIRKGYPIFVRHMLNDLAKDLVENTCFEAGRSLDYFYENSGINSLDKLLVSGGHMADEGFRSKLGERLKVSAELGNPLQGLAATDDAELIENPHLYAVALGLARISMHSRMSARLEAGFF